VAVSPSRLTNVLDVLRAEWTKLWTTPGTPWLLLAVAAVTVAGSAATVGAVECPTGGCTGDPAKISLTGVQLGQALVVIVAALMVGGEYSNKMILTTFAAMPRRTTVLAVKSVIVGAVIAVTGTIAALACVLIGRLVLPDQGFTAANGFDVLSLADGPVQRAAFGSVLYLVLVALLTLGITTIVRDTAAAIGIVLGLLYVFTIVAQLIPDADLQEDLKQIAPMTAGLAIQATEDLANLPISPWDGIGVLAIWAGGALLVGGILLRRRDA
jgi:ABC-2 type transport system permease protein